MGIHSRLTERQRGRELVEEGKEDVDGVPAAKRRKHMASKLLVFFCTFHVYIVRGLISS